MVKVSLYKFTHISLLKNDGQLKQKSDKQPKKKKKSNHPNVLKIKIIYRKKKSLSFKKIIRRRKTKQNHAHVPKKRKMKKRRRQRPKTKIRKN